MTIVEIWVDGVAVPFRLEFRERVDAVADEFASSPEVLEIVAFIRAEPLRPLVLPERDAFG